MPRKALVRDLKRPDIRPVAVIVEFQFGCKMAERTASYRIELMRTRNHAELVGADGRIMFSAVIHTGTEPRNAAGDLSTTHC